MKKAATMYLVNLPVIDPAVIAFTFTTQNAEGNWTFVFKFGNGVWQGWATLPSGEVRPFGCVPNVFNWSGFLDFGIVLISGFTAPLAQGDLMSSGNSLVLVRWA